MNPFSLSDPFLVIVRETERNQRLARALLTTQPQEACPESARRAVGENAAPKVRCEFGGDKARQVNARCGKLRYEGVVMLLELRQSR